METAQSFQVFNWRLLSEDPLAIYILTPEPKPHLATAI